MAFYAEKMMDGVCVAAIAQMERNERAKCVVLHEGGTGGLYELPQSGLGAVGALARKLEAQTQVQGRDERATGDARYAALDEAYAACFETATITGSSWMTLSPDGNSFTLRQHEPFASSDTIREQATQAERARILALLHELRPLDEPYSRRDWELERKGERRMLERITKAIEREQHSK